MGEDEEQAWNSSLWQKGGSIGQISKHKVIIKLDFHSRPFVLAAPHEDQDPVFRMPEAEISTHNLDRLPSPRGREHGGMDAAKPRSCFILSILVTAGIRSRFLVPPE